MGKMVTPFTCLSAVIASKALIGFIPTISSRSVLNLQAVLILAQGVLIKLKVSMTSKESLS